MLKFVDSSTLSALQQFYTFIIIIIIIMEFVDSSTLSALQQFYTDRVLLQMLLHSYLKLSSSKIPSFILQPAPRHCLLRQLRTWTPRWHPQTAPKDLPKTTQAAKNSF